MLDDMEFIFQLKFVIFYLRFELEYFLLIQVTGSQLKLNL